jgi:signal peptidase II
MTTEPAPRLDVRVGSATDGLTPFSSAERPLGAGVAQWAALVAVALAAIIADQATKHLVSSSLALGEKTAVVGPFAIHHVQNSGIAFGFFSGATPIVIVLTAVAIAWMLLFFSRSGRRHPILPPALGLVIGGSVSNLADRVRLGHVTDFLDLRFWPAFNLADTFIVLGVAFLLAGLLWTDSKPPPRRAGSALLRP